MLSASNTFVQLWWHKALSPKNINIQFPLIVGIVKHALSNNHYRNTRTQEIPATLKVISATTKVILATNKLVSASDKFI